MELHDAESLVEKSVDRARELIADDNSLEMTTMLLEQVLRCDPDHQDALQLMGLCKYRAGDYAEATVFFRKALGGDPGNAENHSNLALCLGCAGDVSGAVESLLRAVDLKPDSPLFRNNLALQYRRQCRNGDAEREFLRSLALKPDAQTWCNLGGLYGEWKNLPKAAECFRKALEVDPTTPYAHEGLAYTHHLNGDLEAGWAEYEHRLDFFPQLSFYAARYEKNKRWRGEDLWGKRLVLYCEQGLGDALHFVRFVPEVKRRYNCHVTLHAPECLEGLFRASELGVDEFFTEPIVTTPHVPTHDAHAAIMSLPYLLRIWQIPRVDPYLKTAKTVTLPDDPGTKIGVCWAGSPTHANDSRRSCPLREFEPLYRKPGASLYSLQDNPAPRAYRHDPTPVDLASGCRDWVMTDCRPLMTDFETTAAVVLKMDLVVTVDTAVLHLAGGLGKKTVGLLPFNPDWRWGLDGGTTPWYPSVRLVRQRTPGDWAGVFREVSENYEFFLSDQ